MNTVIQPDSDALEVLHELCQGSRAPARMYGVRLKNGRMKWFLLKGGAQYIGETQREVLKKLYIARHVYGWK